MIQDVDPAFAHIRAQREREEALRRRNEEREHARRTAHELLVETLLPEQRAQYEATPPNCTQHNPQGVPSFRVQGSAGGRYCIHLGRQHNVYGLDENGRHTYNFCGHVGEPVPDEDNILAQKFVIEDDEPRWLQVANRGSVR